MSVWDWLCCCCSNRGRARWRFKRGMARAKKHNHEGAIDDYTMVIDIVETPAELRNGSLSSCAAVCGVWKRCAEC